MSKQSDVTVASVERFLFEEAELLDTWKLEEWLALTTPDVRYEVPPIGVAGAEDMRSDTTLFVIADDREGLAARVERMTGKAVWAEMPRSNLRRIVGNVRVLEQQGDEIHVAANFCCWRVRRADMTTYVGRYRYVLVRAGDSFHIRRKRVFLDIDVLRAQGGLSFIL